MRHWILLTLLTLLPAPLRAEILARPVSYADGATALEGVLLHESTGVGKRPGVLLAHELGAKSPIARAKAERLVRLGYVVLSADLYGKSVEVRDAEDAAAKLALAGKDRTLIRSRIAAGLAALERQQQVDPKRVAAVGYGTGGTAVLELARAKGELEGVVCIHGDIAPAGSDGKNVVASVLAIVGADDPRITPAQVSAFEEEMRSGGVDWQILRMGGVAGDFTNPLAGKNLKTGRAYDPDADRRASDAVRGFLAEMFAPAVLASTPAAPPKAAPQGIPDKVLKILSFVDKNGEAMDGYEGGRTFGNFEKRLPQNDDKGRRIKYREWDVNPLRPGINRGAERMVTGSDGAAYYTSDHYKTFTRIRPPGAMP